MTHPVEASADKLQAAADRACAEIDRLRGRCAKLEDLAHELAGEVVAAHLGAELPVGHPATVALRHARALLAPKVEG